MSPIASAIVRILLRVIIARTSAVNEFILSFILCLFLTPLYVNATHSVLPCGTSRRLGGHCVKLAYLDFFGILISKSLVSSFLSCAILGID